jgi:hypothetical protein
VTAAAVWERRLESEGLAPIDRELERANTARRSWRRGAPTPEPAKAAAVNTWLAWAQDVMRTHKFDTPWQRRVWSLYAQGRRLAEVAVKLKASKRAVTRALERVERWAPPAPVANPWRKLGQCPTIPEGEDGVRTLLLRTNRRVTVRICMLALQCADRGRLLELFAGDPQLSRLVPPNEPTEDTMAEAKRLHYTRILLKRDVLVERPRIGAPARNRFVNVEGTPHAGGINVELETQAADGSPTRTTITVPWDGITQADRVEPEAAE